MQSGRLNSVTDAKGNQTTYKYNANNGLLTSVTSGNETVNYTYGNNYTKLTDITHSGFKYSFSYDSFGNTTATKVAGTTLMTNTYQSNNGSLTKSTYGNGDYTEYTYNSYGQTTKVKKNGTTKYIWKYNSLGMPYYLQDNESGRTSLYQYDSLGRLITSYMDTKDTADNRFVNCYKYDTSNNVTKVTNIADGHKVGTIYAYDKANRPSETTMNSSVSYEYTYESLGRLSRKTMKNSSGTDVVVKYTYWLSNRNDGDDETYRTTQLGWEDINGRTYRYDYDKVGNITSIQEKINGVYKYHADYTYDALGQITRENNVDLNQTIVYAYDSGGNITSKTFYPYTQGTLGTVTKTINYTYDSQWKDKLTGYDGQSITYDAIGNPLTYRNNMSFTWQGRQMKTANLN